MSAVTGAGLPGPPGDAEGPVFAEAWQAEVFATTMALSEAGVLSASEWTAALSEAIAEAQRAGDPDLGDTYYQHWSSALERLCRTKGLLDGPAIDERSEAWRRAYLRTPHGQPVELETGR